MQALMRALLKRRLARLDAAFDAYSTPGRVLTGKEIDLIMKEACRGKSPKEEEEAWEEIGVLNVRRRRGELV
jgi:hypothetical protein